MIRTKTLWEAEGQRRGAYIQFATRQFAIGYSWEWGTTLFLFLGCFVVVIYNDQAHQR